MKPLGGGLIDNVHLCFRCRHRFEGVIPDPGIEASSQPREILGVMDARGALSVEEHAGMERYRRQLGNAWYHRCNHCQPCPRHISISTVLGAKSFVRRLPIDKVRFFVEAPFKEAENCQACRQCVRRCPYHLDIPALL
jgi:predicted aldo/keto reductase-like oxidoreductase